MITSAKLSAVAQDTNKNVKNIRFLIITPLIIFRGVLKNSV